MKQILMIRHAKSSWANPTLADIDRPLNKRGKRDAPIMAHWLKNKIDRLDLIITSPAKRARKTASSFVSKFFEHSEGIQVNRLLYDAYTQEILSVIKNIPDEYTNAAIFGHNPGFTDFVNLYTEQPIYNVPTCGIVAIDFRIENWEQANLENGKIKWYMFPKMLK